MGSFIRSFMDWKGKDCMFLGLEGFLALDWTGLDWTGLERFPLVFRNSFVMYHKPYIS